MKYKQMNYRFNYLYTIKKLKLIKLKIWKNNQLI